MSETDLNATNTTLSINSEFEEIVKLIRHAQHETFKLINTALIDLYWSVG